MRFLVVLVAIPALAAPASSERIAPLLEGLGNHHHAVETDSEDAQTFFDQGLRLSYAFNHRESARSFREAQRNDPGCAMAYWGEALVLGPNINAAMEDDDVPVAWAAIRRAVELATEASEAERGYIQALAKRYVLEPLEDRSALDLAYANAMREHARAYPEDLDARTLFAEALMDLHPWDYWDRKTGGPRPWTPEITRTLEAVLREFPEHPGANHLYIHAVEASKEPFRAEASAERLGALMPSAGHIVHMPSHVYIRVGRYHEGSIANQRAIEADNDYVTQCHAQGIYPLAYMPHNHHFLWATATLEGNAALAIDAAMHTAHHADAERMLEPGWGTLQHFKVIPLYTDVRFGRWDEILARSAPEPGPETIPYPHAIWRYARGIAFARTGRPAEADRELARVVALGENPKLADVTIWDINATTELVAIAGLVLEGEILAARGEHDQAVVRLEKAIEIEEGLNYNEPPDWFFPVRQNLGAVLLEAGRAAEAESVYRADLEEFPENGWSLVGLRDALAAQGRHDAAERVEARFRAAWAHADVELTSSRF